MAGGQVPPRRDRRRADGQGDEIRQPVCRTLWLRGQKDAGGYPPKRPLKSRRAGDYYAVYEVLRAENDGGIRPLRGGYAVFEKLLGRHARSGGATTFWEAFDPAETGRKSTPCTAGDTARASVTPGGASPVYLLAAYVVGVMPKEGGFVCRPKLSVLPPFEFSCPIAGGKIKISYTGKKSSSRPGRLQRRIGFSKGSGV